MIRNLKALGLALVAVFAMSAMAATAAQAEEPAALTVEPGTTTVDMRTAPITPGVFVRQGRSVSCKNGEIQAHDTEQSGGTLNNATTITTTAPVFTECTSPSLGKPATVFMNGCHFTFHLTADDVIPEDTWTATSDLNCPAGKEVTIEIYNDAAHKEILCRFHFASQGEKEHIDLTNKPAGSKFPTHPKEPKSELVTPKNWIEAHINVTDIKSTKTIGTILNCGGATDEKGELVATAEIFGTNSLGGQTGVTISTHT